jgi:hypothetical protein
VFLQIAVDVVSMGDVDTNASKLQVFVDAASSNNNRFGVLNGNDADIV